MILINILCKAAKSQHLIKFMLTFELTEQTNIQ